jgi:hypothetical protein
MMLKNINMKTTLIYFIVASPIFIAFDGTNLYTDLNPFHRTSTIPAFPISQWLIAIIALLNLKYLSKQKILVLLFIYSFPSIIFAIIMNPNYRSIIIIFLQVGNFFITLLLIKKILPRNLTANEFLISLFLGILFLLVLKGFFDFFIYDSYQNNFFLNPKLMIYNWYDYFHVLYIFLMIFSLLYCFKKGGKKSASLQLVSFFAIFITWYLVSHSSSRVLSALMLTIPFLFVFSYVKIKYYFELFVSLIISGVMIFFIIFFIDYTLIFPPDISLGIRAEKIQASLKYLNILNFIYPSASNVRIYSVNAHNELLNIYTALGLPVFLISYGKIISILRKITSDNRLLGSFLLLLIGIGGLIQNNILQSYSGILVASIMGGFLKVHENNATRAITAKNLKVIHQAVNNQLK